MRSAVVGLGIVLGGCAINPMAMTTTRLRDAPQYALAEQTPQSERIEGVVGLIESYERKNESRTRMWIVGDGGAYVLECPEYHTIANGKAPYVISIPGTVIKQEKGLRIYDGQAICRQLG